MVAQRSASANGSSRPAYELVWTSGPVRREGQDDLLTGGLGLDGLRKETAPSAAGLRTRMIHTNFRELVDLNDEGGFGRLYGPRAASEMIVRGEETSALLRLAGRRHPFETRLLIPDGFGASDPLLVVAPSSGSRGALGAIGDVGAWVLMQGHALVLTEKGDGRRRPSIGP